MCVFNQTLSKRYDWTSAECVVIWLSQSTHDMGTATALVVMYQFLNHLAKLQLQLMYKLLSIYMWEVFVGLS